MRPSTSTCSISKGIPGEHSTLVIVSKEGREAAPAPNAAGRLILVRTGDDEWSPVEDDRCMTDLPCGAAGEGCWEP